MKKSVIVVSSLGLGETQPSDSRFGSEMLGKFLRTVESRDEKPLAILFYTEGVKNVVRGAPHLPVLQELADKGVPLIVCKTCLVYFKIEDQVAIGTVGGMDDMVDWMAKAASVITI